MLRRTWQVVEAVAGECSESGNGFGVVVFGIGVEVVVFDFVVEVGWSGADRHEDAPVGANRVARSVGRTFGASLVAVFVVVVEPAEHCRVVLVGGPSVAVPFVDLVDIAAVGGEFASGV